MLHIHRRSARGLTTTLMKSSYVRSAGEWVTSPASIRRILLLNHYR